MFVGESVLLCNIILYLCKKMFILVLLIKHVNIFIKYYQKIFGFNTFSYFDIGQKIKYSRKVFLYRENSDS